MMYKDVKKPVEGIGLRCDDKAGIACGDLGGIYLVVEQDPSVQARHLVTMWVKPLRGQPSPSMSDFPNDCTGRFKYLQTATYSGYRLTLQFQASGLKWGKNYVPQMEEVLRAVTDYCASYGFVNCCEACGAEQGISAYSMGSGSRCLCDDCYSKAESQLQERIKEQHSKKGSLITGLVGALLGSLVGVIAWVLVYQLGYIAAVVGLVIVVCTFKGFTWLGGKLNLTGILCCLAISAGMLYVGEQACIALEIYRAYNSEYAITFFDAFRAVPAFLEDDDLRNAVVSDLLFGYLFMVVGSFSTIRGAYHANNKAPSTRKMEQVSASAPITEE